MAREVWVEVQGTQAIVGVGEVEDANTKFSMAARKAVTTVRLCCQTVSPASAGA